MQPGTRKVYVDYSKNKITNKREDEAFILRTAQKNSTKVVQVLYISSTIEDLILLYSEIKDQRCQKKKES